MPKEFSEWEWDYNEKLSPEEREKRYQAYLISIEEAKAKKEFISSHSPVSYSSFHSQYPSIVAYPTDYCHWSFYAQSSPAPEGWEGPWGEYFSFCVCENAPSSDCVLNDFYNWLENCE